MDYFNIVLRPPSDLSTRLTDFCQENFVNIADGYCLSDNVLPHITLCQFKAETMPELTFDNIKKAPTFEYFNLREGEGHHQGYLWGAVLIKREDWLINLQQYTKNKLSPYNVEILTKNYEPHLTFYRTKLSNKDKFKAVELEDNFLSAEDGWFIEVGKSDENGQYFG